MRAQGRGDIDLHAIGMSDADTPRVEVHLAADAPGEERRLPTIFAVADDRMADRRHMNAQLMRAPGEGLKLDPGGAIARAFDHAVAAARELPVFLIDVQERKSTRLNSSQ